MWLGTLQMGIQINFSGVARMVQNGPGAALIGGQNRAMGAKMTKKQYFQVKFSRLSPGEDH